MKRVQIQHKKPKYTNKQKTKSVLLNFVEEKTQNWQNLLSENRFATLDEVVVTLSNGEAWSGGDDQLSTGVNGNGDH